MQTLYKRIHFYDINKNELRGDNILFTDVIPTQEDIISNPSEGKLLEDDVTIEWSMISPLPGTLLDEK